MLLLSLMCAVETEDDCFHYTGAGIEAFFSDTDTEPMPAVLVDTEYPMPVSVSTALKVEQLHHA